MIVVNEQLKNNNLFNIPWLTDHFCDCSFEAEADTFFDDLLKIFIRGGTVTVIAFTTSYLIDKTIKHSGKIKELFSRLEECEQNHESSHELKKIIFSYV